MITTLIDLEQITLDTIKGIEAEKRRAKREPHHVMLIADNPFKNVEALCCRSEFNEILRELVKKGLIKVGRTINDTYITAVEFEEFDSAL